MTVVSAVARGTGWNAHMHAVNASRGVALTLYLMLMLRSKSIMICDFECACRDVHYSENECTCIYSKDINLLSTCIVFMTLCVNKVKMQS